MQLVVTVEGADEYPTGVDKDRATRLVSGALTDLYVKGHR